MELKLLAVFILLGIAVFCWIYLLDRLIERLSQNNRPTVIAPEPPPKTIDLDKSRAVIKGQIAEQMAPFLNGFPFHPGDVKFVGGQPIDVLVFVGMSDGNVQEVILGDIKVGSSKLSDTQRAIRNAVNAGRVRWQTIHIDRDNYHITLKE